MARSVEAGVKELRNKVGAETTLDRPAALMQEIIQKVDNGSSDYVSIKYGRDNYWGNEAIIDLKIGNDITKIAPQAFQGCINLKNLNIPNSVTSIGDYAFDGIESVTSLIIPSNVEYIGKNAFYNCVHLVDFSISEGVVEIDESAFEGCNSLKTLILPRTITKVGDKAFAGLCHDSRSSVTTVADLTAFDSTNIPEFGWSVFGDYRPQDTNIFKVLFKDQETLDAFKITSKINEYQEYFTLV